MVAPIKYSQMQVSCPCCGAESSVPWDRLDGLLHCKACKTWAKMDKGGRLVEAESPTRFSVEVRSSFSGWKRVRVLLAARRPLDHLAACGWWGRRHLAVVATGMLALVALVGALANAQRAGRAPVAVEAELPTSLDARAGAWAEAWLTGNTARLLQLVERSRDRELRRWLRNHPSPSPAEGEAKQTPRCEVKSIVRAEKYLADVNVTVHWGEGPGTRQPLVLKQLWHQRDGVWYFWPSLRP